MLVFESDIEPLYTHRECSVQTISGRKVSSPPLTLPTPTFSTSSSSSTTSASSMAPPKKVHPHPPSAASVLSSLTSHTPTSSPATLPLVKRSPPPTPTSPELEAPSPVVTRKASIPSANTSFEQFKKQALEKSERVSIHCMTSFPVHNTSFPVWLWTGNETASVMCFDCAPHIIN